MPGSSSTRRPRRCWRGSTRPSGWSRASTRPLRAGHRRRHYRDHRGLHRHARPGLPRRVPTRAGRAPGGCSAPLRPGGTVPPDGAAGRRPRRCGPVPGGVSRVSNRTVTRPRPSPRPSRGRGRRAPRPPGRPAAGSSRPARLNRRPRWHSSTGRRRRSARSLGEQVLLQHVGQPGHPDAEQPYAAVTSTAASSDWAIAPIDLAAGRSR